MPITSQDIALQDIIDRLNFTYVNVGNTFDNIVGASTTQVKTGPGTLHSIIINNAVLSGTVTIYDNTASSGTKIATITLPVLSLTASQIQLNYNCSFSTGLRVVTTGANLDITVIYD